MTKQEIDEILAKHQHRSELAYQHYQETGERRYETAYQHADEIVDICRQALSAVDDHQRAGEYKAYICQWASEAIKLTRGGFWMTDSQRTERLLKDIAAIGRMLGIADPWRG